MTIACPAPEDLSRAFSEGEPNIAEHAETCHRCGAEWDGMGRLRHLARALPSPPIDPAAVGGVRARLLGTVVNNRRRATRTRTMVWAGVAIAAAVTIALGVRGRHAEDSAAALAYHGTVTAFPGARFVRESALPNEVIRLEAGAIHVEVTPLHPGERFVVRAGDGEVEVRGTAFDVDVAEGHLTAVHVVHGRVEVRNSGAVPIALGAGEAWQAAAMPHPSPLGSTEAPDLGPSAPGATANVADVSPSAATSARAPISKSMNAVPAPNPSRPVSTPPPSRSPGAAPDTAPPPPPTAATTSLPGAATTPPSPMPFVPSPPAPWAPSAEPSRERPDHQEERRERRDERRQRLDQRRLR